MTFNLYARTTLIKDLRKPVVILGSIGILNVGFATEPKFPSVINESPALSWNSTEPYNTGWQINVDNDVLISSTRDKDYTGGIAVAFGGSRASTNRVSLDPALSWVNSKLRLNSRLERMMTNHLMQFGLIVFTPGNIAVNGPIFDDRPFASLVFLENSQIYVDESANRVYQTTLTVGILGSGLGEALQNTIHRLQGNDTANGYDYEISHGGEPTARYAVSRQSLLVSRVNGEGTAFELKYRLQGNIGYITEGSVNIAARWGRISSPWWGFAPSRSNYLPQLNPLSRHGLRPTETRELYFWSAFTLHTRAYNAFLQGQFRDSVVTFPAGALNHVIGDLSIGLTASLGNSVNVSYSFHYQTNEIKRGIGARNIRWGGLTISRSF